MDHHGYYPRGGHHRQLGTGGAPLHYNPHRHLMPNPLTRRQKIIIGTTTGVALVTVLAIVFWPGSASAAEPVAPPPPGPEPKPAPKPAPKPSGGGDPPPPPPPEETEEQVKLRALGYQTTRAFQGDWNKWAKRPFTLNTHGRWEGRTPEAADLGIEAMRGNVTFFGDLLDLPGGMKADGSADERKELLRILGYPNTSSGISDFQNHYNRWDQARSSLVSDGRWGPNTANAALHAVNVLVPSRYQDFRSLVFDG